MHLSLTRLKTVTLIALGLLISGCATSIQVNDEFPVPLVEKLPLTVGIVFNEKLSNYVHVEDPMMDAEWTIDIGQANLNMFRSLFIGMFDQTLEVDFNEDGTLNLPTNTQLDAIIEPRLIDFEFSVPRQSGNDQFTVWVKYKLRMTKPDAEPIGDWRVTGYGQVDQGMVGIGDDEAMQEAAIVALRDAAANIATGFERAPGVKKKLLQPGKLMFREQNPDAS